MDDTSTVAVGATGNLFPPLDKLLSNAKRAEEAGFESIFWPDHLMAWHPESLWTPDLTPLASIFSSPHVYVDVVAAISAAATVTENVRLGTAVTEAFRRHPAVIASEFITLHHFSAGRAILGIGAGEGENIVPYGIDFSSPAGRLEEALEVIRLLWTSGQEPVDYEGQHFALERAVLGMGPFEGSFPEIWVAAHGPRMCRITGRLGDGWIPTSMPLEAYAARWQAVRQAAVDSGRDPDQITASLFTYAVPVEDHEDAHRLMEHPLVKAFGLALDEKAFEAAGVEHPLGAGSYGLVDYIPAGIERQEAERLVDAIPFEVVHEYVWHGSADELADQARRYAAVGLKHVIPWNIAFFGDISVMSESYRVLGEMVALLG